MLDFSYHLSLVGNQQSAGSLSHLLIFSLTTVRGLFRAVVKLVMINRKKAGTNSSVAPSRQKDRHGPVDKTTGRDIINPIFHILEVKFG
jgi:hypothetical protein